MDLEELIQMRWQRYKEFKTLLDSVVSTHPLKQISFSDIYTNTNINRFLSQIEEAYTFISNDTDSNKKWFESKIKEVEKSKELKQVSSKLGEIRAYSILKKSDFGDNLKCNFGKGCDFTTTVKVNEVEYRIDIEVNTPLGCGDESRTVIDHSVTIEGKYYDGPKEYAPFGFPGHPEIDSIGSEVITRINRIKQDEKQFNEKSINILFIDFVNPFLDAMDIMNGHCKPFILHNAEVFTGNIWWAFYSKNGENIFFNKRFHYPRRYRENDIYRLPYNGKCVSKKSKVDFVICNMFEGIFILEKEKSHKKRIPREVYLSLMTLQGLGFENLWLNYPIKDLSQRVKRTKKQAKRLFKSASFLPKGFD